MPRRSLSVRPAVENDEPQVTDLLRQIHPDQSVSFRPEEIRHGARSFVATEDEEVVGFALATFVEYGIESYGVIEELVVDPAERGGGIGSALVGACRKWLVEQGVQVVFVSALDQAAEAFYERCGFARCTGLRLY